MIGGVARADRRDQQAGRGKGQQRRAGDMRDRRAEQGQAAAPPRWRRSAGAGAYSWVTT
jgi:hypothetical protein